MTFDKILGEEERPKGPGIEGGSFLPLFLLPVFWQFWAIEICKYTSFRSRYAIEQFGGSNAFNEKNVIHPEPFVAYDRFKGLRFSISLNLPEGFCTTNTWE